jgi:hypothetical protein
VAFCDFRKAFDTVSRDFLFAVMARVLGPGCGMIAWARVLLGATRASAVLNGFESRPAASAAGVRQGCPLSPALYLFVALALSAWLQAQPAGVVGVDLGPAAGGRRDASQFADDTEVLLPDLAHATVARFLGVMAVFARASGQHLNADKTVLLPVGDWPAAGPLPEAVHGLKVVRSAEALGMRFSNDPGDSAAGVDWDARLEGVQACYGRLAKLPLSIFGRSFGASGYGVSKLLYHAEFAGLPEAVARRLASATAKLVDRGLAPASAVTGMPGVPSALLPGHPARGGFGALPWREHVAARHAALAKRALVFLTGEDPSVLVRARRPPAGSGSDSDGQPAPVAAPVPPPEPLWVPLVRALLGRLCPALPPAFALLAAAAGLQGGGLNVGAGAPARLPAFAAGGDPGELGPRVPPGPLQRMAAGLRALGSPAVLAAPAAGTWCGASPLWGNPLLGMEAPDRPALRAWEAQQAAAGSLGEPTHAGGYWRAHGFAALAPLALRGLATVADARALWLRFGVWRAARQALPLGSQFMGDAARASCLRQVWGLPGLAAAPAALYPVLQDPVAALALVPALWHRASGGGAWAAQLLQAAPGPLDWGAATLAAVRAVGWRMPMAAGAPPGAPAGGDRGQQPPPVAALSAGFTVKSATLLQLGGLAVRRRAATRRHVAAALGLAEAAPGVDAALRPFASALDDAWYVGWENSQKEALWRLLAGGVPAAGGHGICPRVPCLCGWAPPAGPLAERALALQRHAFWAAPGPGACPVAAAVVGQLRAALPAGSPLACQHVWLLREPVAGRVPAGLWPVVSMAALSAMWYGRRCAWAFHKADQAARDADGRRQATLEEFWGHAVRRLAAAPADGPAAPAAAPAAPRVPAPPAAAPPPPAAGPAALAAAPPAPAPPPAAGPAAPAAAPAAPPARRAPRPSPLQRAAVRARADFWIRLRDWAALGSVAPAGFSADSPFLCRRAGGQGGSDILCLNVPTAAGAAAI